MSNSQHRWGLEVAHSSFRRYTQIMACRGQFLENAQIIYNIYIYASSNGHCCVHVWYKREALPPLVIAEMTDANSAGQHQAPVVLRNSKELSVPNWCTLGMMHKTSPQIITDYSGDGEDNCRNWGTETRPLLFPLLGSVFQHRFYRFMFFMVRVGACCGNETLRRLNMRTHNHLKPEISSIERGVKYYLT